MSEANVIALGIDRHMSEANAVGVVNDHYNIGQRY
jgi:hypothetical protein